MKAESGKKPRGHAPFSAETQAAIVRLYSEQYSTGNQVAAQLALDVPSVYAFLRQAGVLRPQGCRNGQRFPGKYRGRPPFSAETQAEILRLYRDPRTTGTQIANQLHLNQTSVYDFLRRAGVLRTQGCTNNKLTPTQREQLIKDMATMHNTALVQRYPLTRDRFRQIRRELGLPSSRVLIHAAAERRQADRQERERCEREQARQRRDQHRQQQRTAELLLVNRVSDRWLVGAPTTALALECGVTKACLSSRIRIWRERYPEKFPTRRPELGRVWKRALQKHWQAFWQRTVPDMARLSRQWKAGVSIKQLAGAMGVSEPLMNSRIRRLRRRFPGKFPRRSEMRRRGNE